MNYLLSMSSSPRIKALFWFIVGLYIFFGTSSIVQAYEQLGLSISPPLTDVTIASGDEWTSVVNVTNPNSYDISLSLSVMNVEAEDEEGHVRFVPMLETSDELQGRTLADWIALPADAITLSAGSNAQVTFTVSVPMDASPGGHYATILVSGRPVDETADDLSVQVSSALSSLLFVRVPGDIVESGAITSFSGGPSFFSLTFENNGNVHLRPEGSIKVTNLWGREVATLSMSEDNQLGYVLPDSARTFSLAWNDSSIHVGPYRATATLTYGSKNEQALLATTTVWIIPFPLLLFILITTLTLLLFMRWLKQRSTRASLVALIVFLIVPLIFVQAASLTGVKDTLSDSDISALSNHTITYTTSNDVTAGQTIKVQFDPVTDAFNLGSIAQADVTTTGMTLVTSCGVGVDEVTVVFDTTAPDENATFTVCTGDLVSAGAKTITFGNTRINNPSTAGAYRITIGGTQTDAGETAVMIIDDVQVTTSIDPTLSFMIEGVAAGEPNANGDSGITTVASTSTIIPFGILSPSTAKTAQQKLTVTTNANNGFVVTLTATAFTNGTNDVDFFRDGAATATPEIWKQPRVVAQNEGTYGHWGITSEDADLNGDEFGTALFAGNFENSRQVFSHNGPSDGVTVHQGTTRIGFKIETSALQDPGTYTSTIMYIVTATY